MSSTRRIQNEMNEIRDDTSGINQSTGGSIYIFPIQNSPHEFQCVVKGPDGSPYHGGIFFLTMELPPQYPLRPPRVTFETPIWHPNVDFRTGNVVLGDLFTSTGWSVQYTLHSILLMIWSALKEPLLWMDGREANSVAAMDCRDDPEGFVNMAQQHTREYAGSEREEVTRANILERMVQMGFDRDMAQSALEQSCWNEDAAVTLLLNLTEDGRSTSSTSDSSFSFLQEFSNLQVNEAEGDWVHLA